MVRRALCIGMLCWATVAWGGTRTIHVSTTGQDANDGLSWSTAKGTVQAGLDTAASGDQVWVAAGEYVGCITLKNGVALYGGFLGSETDLAQRNSVVNVTVLDGGGGGSVVTLNSPGAEETRVDGCTIRNGTGTSDSWLTRGGGIYCSSGVLVVSSNTITGNRTDYGGGIYCCGGVLTVSNNTITGNSTAYGGGGIELRDVSPVIAGNTITNNTGGIQTAGMGGGILCWRGSPVIAGNTIADNSCTTDGGGIYCHVASGTITGNTITGNNAYTSGTGIVGGGGICCYAGNTVITNNVIRGNSCRGGDGAGICSRSNSLEDAANSPTIANNTITGNLGQGLCCDGTSPAIINNTISGNAGGGIKCARGSATISNTIVAFNSSGIYVDSAYGSPTLRHNCVYGNVAGDYSNMGDPTGADGNISVDPKLAGAAYGNVWIQPGSPCIDAGDDDLVLPGWTDMNRQPRILGTHVDIGADESDGITTWPSGPSVIVHVSPAGDDSNDGASWTNPKKTVQAGIDAAAASGGEVWVRAGTYVEAIALRNYAYVYGGFSGTETDLSQRDVMAHVTVLDGNGGEVVVDTHPCVKGACTIDGFTIRNSGMQGTAVDCRYPATIANSIIVGRGTGTGIICSGAATISGNTVAGAGTGIAVGTSANPIVTGNTIRGNTYYGIWCSSCASSAAIQGNHVVDNGSSGIRCESCSPMVQGNTIMDNRGGGIYCASASPTIADNLIVSNTASCGGGIRCSSSSPIIRNNTIRANRATDSYWGGGGIFCSASSPTIANNTILGNIASAAKGGGIYSSSSSPTIVNSTIVGNGAVSGGAIYCSSASLTSVTIGSTIIAFNSSGIGRDTSGTDTVVVRCCCVYGNAGYNYSGLSDPTGTSGNISADPRFADVRYGNVHLSGSSPCVDAGDDSAVAVGELDMDGHERTVGSHVDIGADEFAPTDPVHVGPGTIVRVAPEGDDASDGSVWEKAKRTVNAGIVAAAGMGGEVWVKEGTYFERIVLPNFVHLYGGFCGTETQRAQRDWSRHVTVLDGQQGGSVVTSAYIGYGTVDGFTIRNGSGVLSGPMRYGGGIWCSSSSPTIANSTITNNGASYGGGIACITSCPVITGCTVAGNSASNGGGGVYCQSSSSILRNNRIVENGVFAGSGGGVFCTGASSPTIANSTIASNAASAGAGIYCTASSSPTIANSTITGNLATSHGAIYCSSASPTVTNSIIAFNSSGVCQTGSGMLSLRSNCVYGNAAYDYSGLTDPTDSNGNISADPQLADVARGNLHLQPTSPCIEAGDDAAVQADWTDIDGQARVQGAHVDIGADESDGTSWPAASAILYVSPDGDDSNDGLSWARAKRTVQAAVDAGGTGSQVWVAAGTYGGTIQLCFGIALYGGFAGGEADRSQRDWRTNLTILDGNLAGSVVTTATGATEATRIDGFTIRNGKASSGGGICCSSSSPTIANNTITSNTASSGGGICCSSSSPTITNNIITGNNATDGGGIYCYASSASICNNAITHNVAASTSGVGAGGGVYSNSSSLILANNSIVGNRATGSKGDGNGGGVYVYGQAPTIGSSTITGNFASSQGGGVYCAGSSLALANTIIAFNSSGIYRTGPTAPSLRSNCVYGNTGYDYSGLSDATGANGNISADPRFVSAGSGLDGIWGTADDICADLHLLPGSPCIDAGSNADVPADTGDLNGNGNTTEPLPLDLSGVSRFADDTATTDIGTGAAPIVDMGTYEYQCGDIDGDGHVSVFDIFALAECWDTQAGDSNFDARCDLDGDGAITVFDIFVIAENWNR